ncbi:response regulator [bacterium]|nr:response regulator [bacterium]
MISNYTERDPKLEDTAIIVVEDDVGMNNLVQKVLSRAGYETIGATSGAEGLKKVADAKNPMVILDYGLPDMNGAKFVEKMTKLDRRVPFLVLTGQGDERVAVDMMKLGAIDYVIKESGFIEYLPQTLAKAMEKVETEKKLEIAEEQLRRANEELERRVLERTKELAATNDKLKKEIAERERVERELKRSNEELEQFAYIASHDLREPIRKVCAFSRLLESSLKGKLDADQAENLNYLIDGADRMMRMVDALLSYSRITTRANPIEEIDLNQTVRNLKAFEVAERLRETGGSIDVPEKLPSVLGDPIQINELMQNLLSNALKFHRDDIPPKIVIGSKKRDDDFVEILVKDNGIGIEEGEAEGIFTMFKRAHDRNKYEGSGIGLAICKKIVERHGGEIGVRSNPEGGSTFWFTLPTKIR